MSKIIHFFTSRAAIGLLVFVIINMIIATIAYFVFDYNLYLPLLAGAFGGFFGGNFFRKKKVVKQFDKSNS
ncbi:MAG: hypothetical protein V4581_17185 [Bacteroidota bacterium]